MECEEQKRSMKFLNENLLKNEEFKGQPQDVVKLHEEIETLKSTWPNLLVEQNILTKY